MCSSHNRFTISVIGNERPGNTHFYVDLDVQKGSIACAYAAGARNAEIISLGIIDMMLV